MELPATMVFLLLIVGIADMPGHNALRQDTYQTTVPAAEILSMAGRIISTAEKTEPGPYADWRLALASTKIVVDLINTVFKHEDGGSWEIRQEVEDAYYEATVSCNRVVRKVYAAAMVAETEVGMLRTVQESLKMKPDHAPALRQLQVVISSGLTMPKSIDRDLEDVLFAYMRVIKLCQTNAIAKERKQVSNKMSGAFAVGVLSGAAGLYYSLVAQVYSVALGAAMVSTMSFSKVLELQRNIAILEDRMEFLREAKDEAGRRYSSMSDIQSLVQALQSRIQGVSTLVTMSDMRLLQDGMRMLLSPDMTHRLQMHSDELLKLQEDCLELSYSINKASRARLSNMY